MKSQSLLNRDKITMKIVLSREDHNAVKEKAERQNITLTQYAKERLLDSQICDSERRRMVAVMLPDYYNHVKGIPDAQLRNYFQEFGETICRYLM